MLDARIALEITVDVLLGRGVVDAQVLGQTVAAHAVNQAEVDHLGIAALLARDLVGGDTKNLGSRRSVHVQTFVESAQQGGVLAQVRHDAQLDLAVVGAGDHMAWRRDERLAHTTALCGFHGDVLQIGFVARKSPRHRHRLGVMRVDTARARVRHLSELVGVGAFELGQAAPLQQLGRQRKILGQFFKHFFIGARRARRGLLDHGQPEFLKEDVPDLLGAAEVERLARQCVGFLFQLHDALAQLRTLPR